MRYFRFFWHGHKWVGIVLALWLLLITVTGFLLLLKKKVDWIQPPIQRDRPGSVEAIISLETLLEVVLAQQHPDFQTLEDIDRVDFRPGHRIFKVIATDHHAEIQVGAISGEVLSVATRRSDLLEQLHDGSFFGGLVHAWLMPLLAAGLVFLTGSGLWVWLAPLLRRRP